MQEPFGAFTWYPVNDQPADKALYDITVHVPAPWTGIANGRLVDLATTDDVTTTSWQLTEPASSYLLTLAVGDYVHSSNTTSSGLRVDYWTPRGMVQGLETPRDRRGVRRLDREQARPLPVRHPGHGRHRVEQRHGDPDDGDPGQHRLRPVPAGDHARAGPPVVRRPGLACRLARRVAQRGHDHADAVALRGRPRHLATRRHPRQRPRRRPVVPRRLRTARRLRPAAVRQHQHLLHSRRDVERAACGAR